MEVIQVLDAKPPVQFSKTVTTAGTRVALDSYPVSVGVLVTNTSATADIYLGPAATVSSTVKFSILAAGDSAFLPVANSDMLGVDASANGATIDVGVF